MNKDTFEIIKVAMLGIITVSIVYMSFFKKEKRVIAPSGSAIANQAPANTLPSSGDQSSYFGPEDNMNLSTTINNDNSGLDARPGAASMPTTSMQFAENAFDFGTIKQNTENLHVFKFTNTGENPLIIQTANGSCGCTVPEYPTEPIAPGGVGEIKVKYSPGNQIGQQQKSVTIMANTVPGETVLNIKAVVEEV